MSSLSYLYILPLSSKSKDKVTAARMFPGPRDRCPSPFPRRWYTLAGTSSKNVVQFPQWVSCISCSAGECIQLSWQQWKSWRSGKTGCWYECRVIHSHTAGNQIYPYWNVTKGFGGMVSANEEWHFCAISHWLSSYQEWSLGWIYVNFQPFWLGANYLWWVL